MNIYLADTIQRIALYGVRERESTLLSLITKLFARGVI